LVGGREPGLLRLVRWVGTDTTIGVASIVSTPMSAYLGVTAHFLLRGGINRSDMISAQPFTSRGNRFGASLVISDS
jgi:hypothetical protein